MRKIRYSPDADILMVRLGEGALDYAEEREGIIVHFSKDGSPVLLEILDATEFVEQALASMSADRTMRPSTLKEAIRLLRRGWVSGREMAERLAIPRSRLPRLLRALKEAGFRIEGRPGRGYRLTE